LLLLLPPEEDLPEEQASTALSTNSFTIWGKASPLMRVNDVLVSVPKPPREGLYLKALRAIDMLSVVVVDVAKETGTAESAVLGASRVCNSL
jgi:hypothetical protein